MSRNYGNCTKLPVSEKCKISIPFNVIDMGSEILKFNFGFVHKIAGKIREFGKRLVKIGRLHFIVDTGTNGLKKNKET